MSKNESALDRAIRMVGGIVIFYLAHSIFSGIWSLAGYVVGIILVFTAVTGYCHLYKSMGISTKKQS